MKVLDFFEIHSKINGETGRHARRRAMFANFRLWCHLWGEPFSACPRGPFTLAVRAGHAKKPARI